MVTDNDLAALQRELLDALESSHSVEAARTQLHEADLSPELRAWADAFDARAIEVAMAIVKRWVRVG